MGAEPDHRVAEDSATEGIHVTGLAFILLVALVTVLAVGAVVIVDSVADHSGHRRRQADARRRHRR